MEVSKLELFVGDKNKALKASETYLETQNKAVEKLREKVTEQANKNTLERNSTKSTAADITRLEALLHNKQNSIGNISAELTLQKNAVDKLKKDMIEKSKDAAIKNQAAVPAMEA